MTCFKLKFGSNFISITAGSITEYLNVHFEIKFRNSIKIHIHLFYLRNSININFYHSNATLNVHMIYSMQ